MTDEFIKQLEKDIESPEFALADKILKLMDDGKTRYMDEIADELNVSFAVVVEVVNVLREQDKLFVDTDKEKENII